MDSVRIDNFGIVGTRILMDSLGVRDLPASFRERATPFIPRLGRLTSEVPRGEGVSWMRTRVVNYWEYNLEWPGGRLQGAENGENALHERARDSRWLRAVTPPFNPFADRRTCSEFRSFDRLLEELSRAGTSADENLRGRVSGCIMMLINAPPCVSCIGVMQQFQLLYPRVVLHISGGRDLSKAQSPVDLTPQQFSDMACAFAALGISDQTALSAISSASIPPLSEFLQTNLTSTAWALADLRCSSLPLLQSIAAASLPTLTESNDPSNLATIAWAVAVFELLDTPLIEAISSSSLPPLESTKPNAGQEPNLIGSPFSGRLD